MLPACPMAQILTLRGASALSRFRVEKIRTEALRYGMALGQIDTCFWHFVEVNEALLDSEMKVLNQILGESAQTAEPNSAGALFLVVPRFGTISPWSTNWGRLICPVRGT